MYVGDVTTGLLGFLTNVVLHVADVEGRGGHGHAEAVFLLSQDGLAEAVLLQVVQSQLAPAQLHNHVVGTAGHKRGFRGLGALGSGEGSGGGSPWKRPAAQLLYEHLAAVLNSFDVCALARVIFTPVPFLFD